MGKKTVCLNMIVKNESHVIRRSLDSVKHLIDYWIIVDTGSMDGTQDIIKEHLKDIPGELHERPWVNFGHNRNEALKLTHGKSDYILFIDADDRLVLSEDFTLPPLIKDMYFVIQKETMASGNNHRENHISLLIKNDEDFEWDGVLHEFLKCPKEKSSSLLSGVYMEYCAEGDRSKDPQKIQKDIDLLTKGISEDPFNARRYIFYLARTYWSIRDSMSALKYFEKRADMGGDPIEVYHCLLFIGILQRVLDYDPQIFINSFCKAHVYRPSRAEALYELARYYTESGNFLLGMLVSNAVSSIPMSTDNLFVEPWVYEWGGHLQFFVSAIQLGQQKEAQQALQYLLSNPHLPDAVRKEFQLDEWNQKLNIKTA